jgi:hypothetical protein
VEEILFVDATPEAAIPSEDGRFHLACRLAEQGDAA